MSVAQFLARPIRAIALVFLARLLDPQDFGIVALAMILFTATDLFAGLGMGNAVIHSKLDTRQIAFQAFVVTVVFSSVLFLVVLSQAPLFARLLGDPAVTPVLRWLSLLIILDAWVLVPLALLRKGLMFNQVSAAKIVSVIAHNGVAVVLAFLGFGLWSLVFGQLAQALSRLVFVWIVCPGWDWLKPRQWDWEAMKGLLRYGIQSTGSGFLAFFNTNWDDWLVGRVLGSTALGFYSKAYDVSNRGIVNFGRGAIDSVFFPSYAKIQDEKKRLSRAYLKGLAMVALIMTPLSMGLLVVAAEAVPILLGEKWIPMILTLQIFCLMALVRPLAASTSPLFQAVGLPKFNLRAGLVQLAVMVPLVFLLLPRGIAGVAAGVTAAFAVGFVFNIYQVHKVLPGTALKMIRTILPALVAGCVMVVGVQLSKAPLLELTGGQHDLAALVAMVTIGAVLYILTAFLIQRTLILETISLVMSVFRGRSRMAFNKS